MTTTPPVQLPTFHAPSGSDLDTWYEILLALMSPWPPYTAVLSGAITNPGVSSSSGAYLQLGHTTFFHANFVLSSGGSGLYTINLPVSSNEGTGSPIGQVTLADVSTTTNRLWRSAWQNGTNSIAIGAEDSTRVDNTHPFVFAAGDTIAVKGMYESA